MNIDALLEEYCVEKPGEWRNDHGPKNWYGVSNNDGIIAYFGDETDAFRFRISCINARLNPIKQRTNHA